MTIGATRAIFAAAALFNLGIGLTMLFAPAMFGASAGIVYSSDALLSVRSAGLLIAVFGIGYAMVARRPTANRDIIRLGIIGKSAFVTLVAVAWATGAVPASQALLVSADLVFAALFWACLARTRSAE